MDAVTSYSAMLPVFLMDLPGVNDPLAKQALYLAGRKFCMDSKLYIKELDPINVQSGTRTYDLSGLLPSNTKIIDIFEARHGSDATTDTTAPMDKSKYKRVDEDTFKFITTPTSTVANGLVVKVILRPTVASTGLESWFYDRYFEPIINYGRYYLLTLSKNQPWHDPERAAMYLEQYKEFLEYYKGDEFHTESDVTAYSSMLSWLEDDFPNISDRTKNQILASSGRKFCIDTKLYESTLTAINVIDDTRTYDLSALIPSNTKIIEIVEARHGSNATDDTTAPLNKSQYSLVDETTFKFTTTPSSSITSGLVVKVNLRPKANSTSIATWFYDRYFEPILEYSKYSLALLSPETTPSAELYLNKYKEYVKNYISEDLFIQETGFTAYSSMLPWLKDELSLTSERIINQDLALAGRKFCLDTKLYEYTLSSINVLNGTRTYDLSELLPTNTKIIDIVEAWSSENATDDTTAPLDRIEYSLEDEDTFKFTTTPTTNITNGLVVKVSLRPQANATSIASWFYDRYFEPILNYAKYLININISEKVNLAEQYLAIYNDYVKSYINEDLFVQKLEVTAYSTMIPWLKDEFNSFNERIINQNIALAGRKFCIDTELYESTLTAVNVVSGTRTYDLSALLPANTKIINIIEARHGASAETDTTAPMERIEYSLINETTFKFTTTPTESITDGLVIKVSVRPEANSTSIESWFYDRYFEPILEYSKYLLYNLTPETVQLSEPHLAKYNEYVVKYTEKDIRHQELEVTTYSTMMPWILETFPEMKEVTINSNISLAGRKFCIDTKLYEYTLTAINVVESTRTYDLSALLPTGTKIIDIVEARYGATAETDTTAPMERNEYILTDEDTFKFVTTPTSSIDSGLVIKVSLRPQANATSIASWFYDRYFEPIMDYTKYLLFNLDNETAVLGEPYLVKYNEYVKEYENSDLIHQELEVTAYSAMLPWIINEFPEVEKRILNQQLSLAGRKFCIDTKLYEETLTAINVVSGTRTYDLSSLLPDNTKIIEIVDARYGSTASTDTSAPMERIDYSLEDETTFKFTTTPTASITGGLVVKVNLRPQANSTSIATWFYDRYFEPILAYAKHMLYANNPETAGISKVYLDNYNAYVEEYKAEDLYLKEIDVTTYSSMLPLLTDEFTGIKENVLNSALALAGRKFCLDTELYTKELDPVDIVADTQSYDLSSLLPTDTKIIRFADVRYGTSATTETTLPYGTNNYSLYEESYFKFITAPETSITDGLVCNVILRPTVSSTGLETWFYDRYYEAIIAYTKYHILNMNGKEWSNPEKAIEYKRTYRDYLDRYKREKFKNYKNGLIHVEHVAARF